MKPVYLFSLLLFLPVFLFGQTNTDFWFAAPEVTSAHGDQPIYLRLTSFSQSAVVVISEPANTVANFPPITVFIAANSTVAVNLTTYKEQVECKPANTALNFGLYIHSGVPITAYYEVANTVNPEIFILKGNNALGTSFYIPSQDVLYNEPSLNPKAWNSFDIIATEDNTTVTITPRKSIVGHTGGVQFTVVLNKGQVYSAQATGQLGTDHLMGSVVTSDNPVAITVKDDSDRYTGLDCYDLTGDQIVPENIIGNQYIVVRGSTSSAINDWVFVTATADNTHISINGTMTALINTGNTYHFNMTTSNLCSYVQTDNPVYLLHLTGYGCETGTALLPAIGCTGSTQVAFTRTTAYTFEMIILTKAGAQGSFTLDGNPALVTSAMFTTVPANPAYVYTKITFPAATLPVGAHILSNSQDVFHMGIIHTYDAGQSGCSYGYFSDFASLNLGPDQIVCPGTPVTFDAGTNRQSYNWYFNGNPYATGIQTITVTSPGSYSVTVDDHGCILSDQVQLSNYPAVNPTITGITGFCQGQSQPLSVSPAFPSYLWSTGATTQSVTVSTSGNYSVTVTDNIGCHGNASVVVTAHPLPSVTLVQPPSTCSNISPYPLTGGSPAGGTYSGPGVNSTTGYFDPASGNGPHLITYSYTDAYGCSGTTSKTLTVNAAPSVQLAAQPSVCISASPFPLSGGTPAGGTYSGTGVNSGTGIFTPSSGAGGHVITYSYTDANGCLGTATKTLTVYALPLVQLAPQAAVCISAPPYTLTGGSPAGGTYSGTGVNSGTGIFTPSSGAGPHNIIYTYTDLNGCTNAAIQSLMVYALPVVQMSGQDGACISAPPFLLTCGTPAGGIYSGPGVNSSTSYFDPSSGTGPHLITYNYTDIHGCTSAASKILTVYSAPDVQLSAMTPVCISVPPFLLTGGTPAGGIYSGSGVNSSTSYFDPSSGTGPHMITYAYTDAFGCTNNATGILEVNQVPSVQLSAQPPVCLSDSPFLLTGGTPAGGVYSGAGVNSSTGFFDPSTGAGSYTITYTFINSGNCTGSDFKTLTVNPLPVVQLSCQDAACISDPPFLLNCGTPAGGIYSGTGVNSSTAMFDPSSGAGVHTITYTYSNANSCVNTAVKTLTVNPLPVVQLSGQDAACISSPPFLLTCGTPAGGIYSGAGVTSSTGYFDPSTGAGVHTISYTFTDAAGCTNFATKALTVYTLPLVQLSSVPAVCVSAPPFQLTGGTPAGGTYSGPGVNSSTGYFDPSTGAGLYMVTYTFTDANGCTGTDSKTLTVNDLPVVLLASLGEVCISAPPFPLTGGSPPGGTYSGTGVNPPTATFDPSSGAGPHVITYTLTNTNGCTNAATKTLIVNALPVVQFAAPAAACISAQPFALSGGTPPGGIYSGAGVNSVTGFFDPSSGAGIHQVTYTYADLNLCPASASASLPVIPMPLPSGTVSGPAAVCEGTQNSGYLLSGPDPLATSFEWEINPSAAGTISGANPAPSVSFNPGFSGIVTLRFRPVSNCGAGNFSGYTNITVNPNPGVTLQSCNDPVTTRGAKPFRLKGGLPAGGVYSIDGLPLPAGVVDPGALSASPPDHTISFAYTNVYNCTSGKTLSLTVRNATGFVCNATLTDVRDLQTYPTFEIVAGALHRCWMG
ncbi:MAG: IgGFc-binding protein, partial [Bacteroidota bacterium]